MVVLAPEEAHLECDIFPGKPAASVRWFKDNREVAITKRHQMRYRDAVATLYIQNTEFTDGGWYKCEASNKYGKVETTCELLVQGKIHLYILCNTGVSFTNMVYL